MTIKLIIVGVKGRMGQRIVDLAKQDASLQFAAGLDVGDSATDLKKGDVAIDFSAPEATLTYLQAAVENGKGYVIGTTGFTGEQDKKIVEASRRIPIVKSSNMSLGVNVFFKAAQQMARALPGYKVHIQETHHVHKKDAPSGTALQAGGLIERVSPQKVTYESFREGEVVGDHRIILTGPNDRIELFHHAGSRDIFAAGALVAAKWVHGKKPGLYTMEHVLELS